MLGGEAVRRLHLAHVLAAVGVGDALHEQRAGLQVDGEAGGWQEVGFARVHQQLAVADPADELVVGCCAVLVRHNQV